MKSERRDTPRIPVALETILNLDHPPNHQHALTRDISLDGCFIETPSDRPARKGPTELAIKLPTEGVNKYHRFQGQIVRVTNFGAGLVFDKVDTDAYAALLDLVFSRQGRGLW